MRTNIELDEELVREGLKLSGLKTKRELVHEALAEYVADHKRKDLRELRGRIVFEDEYDYKQLREDKARGPH